VTRPAEADEPASEAAAQSVGYALSQLGFETSRRFADLEATVALEPREFALLRAVAERQGQSQQAVAEHLRIPTSTMVAVVDGLEEQGLIERRLHASDRRTRTLHLTSKGSKILAKAVSLAWGFEREVCAGFDESERSRLLGLLGRVADNIGLDLDALPDRGSGRRRPHA
jgi:DNA-binding MarR family transcriptional regulator